MPKQELCPWCKAQGRSVCKFVEEVKFMVFRAKRTKGPEKRVIELSSLPKRIGELRERYRWGPYFCTHTNANFRYPTPEHPKDLKQD